MELNDFLEDKTSEIAELGIVEHLDSIFSFLSGVDFSFCDCSGNILSSTLNSEQSRTDCLSEYNKLSSDNRFLIRKICSGFYVLIMGVFIEESLKGVLDVRLDLSRSVLNVSKFGSQDGCADQTFDAVRSAVDQYLRYYNFDQENRVLQTRIRHFESSVNVLRKEHHDIQSINVEQREELEKTNEELSLNKKQLEDYGKNLEKKVEDRTLELKLAKEKAEEANKLKSQLLANMSHEMRTPLNSIIGFTELVLEDDLDETHREYLEKVSRNGTLLLSLINDILDLSKIQAKQMKLENIPSSLEKFFADTESNAKSLILQKKKTIEIRKVIDPELRKSILCDPVRLQQVMNNLMSNAVKFTDQGFVEFGASLKDGNMLLFYFKDTGIGIPKEHTANIFDSFQQADMSTTRKYGGTGLGLTITKQIVSLMGGDIRLESVPGEGTTFYFTIPCKFCNDSDSINDSAQEGLSDERCFNILIAEDSIDNQLLAERILTKKGHSVIIANNGQEAVDIYQDKHDAIDIILMDMQMPVLGGLEATEKIRGLENKESMTRVPIIALTANAMKGIKEECLRHGCDDYATKPLNKKELFPAIQGLAGSRKTADLNSHSKNLDSPCRIIIADDSKNNQLLLELMLKKTGFQFMFVDNGQEAFDVYVANHDEVDIVLMDMQMPIMNGHEATQAIRQFERAKKTGNVPIVALTAGGIDGSKGKCLQSGCDEHLIKPISKKNLIEVIVKLTGKAHSDPSLAKNNITVPDAGKKVSEIIPDSMGSERTIQVMVVDDSKNNRMLVETILNKSGYRTLSAENGKEAVDLYCKNSKSIDCILMDMQMPVLDGLEATRMIRAYEKKKGTGPVLIVALTAGSEGVDMSSCMAIGCDEYMTKPVKRKELLAVIDKYFMNKH